MRAFSFATLPALACNVALLVLFCSSSDAAAQEPSAPTTSTPSATPPSDTPPSDTPPSDAPPSDAPPSNTPDDAAPASDAAPTTSADPCVPDRTVPACDDDGDGLTNEQEATFRTKATVADTDGDGVLDGAEVLDGNADSDGDGSNDALESNSSDGDGDGVVDELDAVTADLVPPVDGDAGLPAGLVEEGDIAELDLQELLREPVVTASGGRAQERALAPANVFVVQRDEIARHGWRTLAEILESTPGLYVIDDGVLPSVAVRGVSGGLRAGTRLIKVMINGVPVHFRPDLTAFLGSEFLPIEAVERVEIAQGPLSALYGANAFIATVNVITRDPGAGLHAEVAGRSHHVGLRGGLGASGVVSHRGEHHALLLTSSLDHIDRSGTTIPVTFPGQSPDIERYRTLLSERGANDVTAPQSHYGQLRLGAPKDLLGQVTLEGGLQRLDAMYELIVNAPMTHRSRYAIDNWWSSVRYDRALLPDLDLSVRAGAATGRPTRDTVLFLGNNSSSFTPRFGYSSVDGSANVSWAPLGERLELRVGIDGELDVEDVLYYRQTFLAPVGERQSGDTVDLIGDDAARTEVISDVGASAQVASTPLPDLVAGLYLVGDLRVDLIRYGPVEVPPQLSWRAAIVYEWTKGLVTKLVGGSAFQAPSGVLMFAKPGYGNAHNVVGNVDVTDIGIAPLRPQSVTAIEALVAADVGVGTIDAGIYAQQITDPIAFSQLATDFVAENGAPVAGVGALASVKLAWDRFSGYTTATLHQGIAEEIPLLTPVEAFPNAFGTAGLNVDVAEAYVRLNGHLRWALARGASQSNILLNNLEVYELPPYAAFDVAVSTMNLRFLGPDSETRVSVLVRNVLDERHAEPGYGGFDLPAVGRSVRLELRQSF